MRAAPMLRFLAIPTAAGLIAALVVACSQSGPTGPRPTFDVSGFTPTTHYYDDNNGVCKNNDVLVSATLDPSVDSNGNGSICQQVSGGGGGPKKK